MALRDTDVETTGSSLLGRRIVLGVTGGIAAVETVRLARALRREGAELTVIMTPSSQRIITPLAVRWASQAEVITDWDGDLTALNHVDAVLVAPATRDVMASHLHGLQHGPLMMALSVARSRKTPILMVPSMHEDLASDPVTDDIVEQLQTQEVNVMWGPHDEGKRKTPDVETIVAQLAHLVNKGLANRKNIVVTLGATHSPIDDVRHVQNTSSGSTGWSIAAHLHKHGHDVTCVAGITTSPQPPGSPSSSPHQPLRRCLPNALLWPTTPSMLGSMLQQSSIMWWRLLQKEKLASQQGTLNVPLVESKKHIMELKERCSTAVRIGFKLESGVKQTDLIHRAFAQIEKAGMTAVIANRLEDLSRHDKPRGYLVDQQGAHFVLQDSKALNDAVQTLIERGKEV